MTSKSKDALPSMKPTPLWPLSMTKDVPSIAWFPNLPTTKVPDLPKPHFTLCSGYPILTVLTSNVTFQSVWEPVQLLNVPMPMTVWSYKTRANWKALNPRPSIPSKPEKMIPWPHQLRFLWLNLVQLSRLQRSFPRVLVPETPIGWNGFALLLESCLVSCC